MEGRVPVARGSQVVFLRPLRHTPISCDLSKTVAWDPSLLGTVSKLFLDILPGLAVLHLLVDLLLAPSILLVV